MKTFILIGLLPRSGSDGTFPKPLLIIQAEDLAAAAGKIGGRVDAAAPDAGKPFSALFVPDLPCGEFHTEARTGERYALALADSLRGTITDEDASALSRGSQSMFKMFSRLLLGQMPVAV